MKSRQFKAKYSGTCSSCGFTISVGEDVYYDDYGNLRHTDEGCNLLRDAASDYEFWDNPADYHDD